MQAKHHDGSYGKIQEFSNEAMLLEMKKPNVSHVEVFEGTEENIRSRQKLFSVKKRYQKAKPTKPRLDLKIRVETPKNKKR